MTAPASHRAWVMRENSAWLRYVFWAAAAAMNPFPALMVLCAGLTACTADIPQIPVQGELAGRPLHTTVDSDIAGYFLEHSLKGERIRPELDAVIDDIGNALGNGTPARAVLQTVARDQSTDLAALMLWQALLRDADNRRAWTLFGAEFSRLQTAAQAPARAGPEASELLILFVPGWFYRSQPGNGADFAAPRRALAAAGVRTALLETEENGTVERNGARIAARLAELSRRERRIVLVSASKAGPEVALALSALRNTAASGSVLAWVNIGGVLRGSPLADRALTWPACWFVKLFVIRGGTFAGIESLTTRRSAERAARAQLPAGILVLNYVGIPLSGQVSERARLGYALLRGDGPNDGLTYIVDELYAPGITLPELGLDHFFGAPDMPVRTLALTNTVIRLAAAQQSASPHRQRLHPTP